MCISAMQKGNQIRIFQLIFTKGVCTKPVIVLAFIDRMSLYLKGRIKSLLGPRVTQEAKRADRIWFF